MMIDFIPAIEKNIEKSLYLKLPHNVQRRESVEKSNLSLYTCKEDKIGLIFEFILL